MSVFGGHIKNNYVCCDCRERVRRGSFSTKGRPHKKPLCPRCGKPMASVGRHFRTPRKSDKKGWERAREHVQDILFRARCQYDKSLQWLRRQHLFKKGR